jgi:hypothetical protein
VTSGASIDQRFSLHKHGNAKSGEKVEKFVTEGCIPLKSLVYARSIRKRRRGKRTRQPCRALNRWFAVAEKSPLKKLRVQPQPSVSRLTLFAVKQSGGARRESFQKDCRAAFMGFKG